MRKQRIILVLLIFFLAVSSRAFSQVLAINAGLSYLSTNQNQTGSWGSESGPVTNEYLATSSVLETLAVLDQNRTPSYQSGIQWLQAAQVNNAAYFAGKIAIYSSAGIDTASDLNTFLSYRNSDNGWGIYTNYRSNNFHTALALQALKNVNYSDQIVINNALGYLLSTQNSDGGWGFCSAVDPGCGDGEGDSNVYMTSLASITLQQFQRTTSIATAINRATAYIVSHQNADGGFASCGMNPAPTSTVHETAYAYMALVGVITDSTTLGSAVNYLTSTQLADGSWNEDPYSTALALRALYIAENRPQPPTPPTTGTVTGSVVDGSTNQLLIGATVVLQSDPSKRTITDQTGSFTLLEVPAGSQQITISSAGYATASITVAMTAGSIVNMGTIRLSSSPNSGTIKGTVVDTSNGQPIQGVTITVSGSYSGTVTTGLDGAFTMTGVTPGNITVTASKTGYYTVTGSGTATSGGTLLFNPQMSTQPPASTTGTLSGSVNNILSGQAIQGATVVVSSGQSASTDATGSFQITGITPGTYQVTVSAGGYTSQSYQAIISAGTTTTLIAGLSPASQFATLAGKVTDSATGQPIQAAIVSVVGTNLSASTDSSGKYTITDISLLEFFVKASAPGHDSGFLNIKAQQYGTSTADFSLKPSSVSDIKIDSLSTDKQSYGPKETVAITGVIDNTGSSSRNVNYIVQISASSGKVLAIIMGQAESFLTLDPHSTGTIGVPWDTAQNLPDTYDISLIVADKAGGSLLAESSTTFAIKPVVGIQSAAPLISPMFVNINEDNTIKVSASLTNKSNVDSTLSASFEVKDQDGTLLESGSVNFTMLGTDPSKVIDIGTFTRKFAHSGQYPVNISILSSSGDILASGSAMINVAPNIRIEPTKTLSPVSVTPDGDKSIHIKIRLQGVEAQQ